MLSRLTRISFCLGLCLTLGAGCKKDGAADEKSGASAAKKPAKPEPKKEGIEAGNAELAAAVKAVIGKCQVSEFGWARNCKDHADRELEKQQKMVGDKEALRTFCYALSDKNHLIQALAANQINRLAFSKRMLESKDETIFRCLVDVLATAKVERVARPVARAATYMATALKKDEEILKLIESSELKQVKAAGYGSLWANGRLRVLPTLAKVIGQEDGDPMIRVAAINGFALGGRLEADEASKICELVAPLMTNAEVRVASAAANRVANSCPELKDKVLDAAEEMIKKGEIDPGYVSAVRNVDGFFKNKASPAQKSRAVALLVKVLKNAKFNDITRSSALRKIAWLDRKEGIKLARKLSKSESPFIKRAAEWVLKTKPASVP